MRSWQESQKLKKSSLKLRPLASESKDISYGSVEVLESKMLDLPKVTRSDSAVPRYFGSHPTRTTTRARDRDTADGVKKNGELIKKDQSPLLCSSSKFGSSFQEKATGTRYPLGVLGNSVVGDSVASYISSGVLTKRQLSDYIVLNREIITKQDQSDTNFGLPFVDFPGKRSSLLTGLPKPNDICLSPPITAFCVKYPDQKANRKLDWKKANSQQQITSKFGLPISKTVPTISINDSNNNELDEGADQYTNSNKVLFEQSIIDNNFDGISPVKNELFEHASSLPGNDHSDIYTARSNSANLSANEDEEKDGSYSSVPNSARQESQDVSATESVQQETISGNKGNSSILFGNLTSRNSYGYKQKMLSEDSSDDDDLRIGGSFAKHRRKKEIQLLADCTNTRYEVAEIFMSMKTNLGIYGLTESIKISLHNVGFTISDVEDKNSFIFWWDSPVSNDRIADLRPYQKVNHFPGMVEICQKDHLARNMAKMARAFPEAYNFTPKSWILPAEFGLFQFYVKDMKVKKKTRTFIVKPVRGAMGIGITLCRNVDKIQPNSAYIIQEYIDRPFLVDGFKCDMRIYVLITSCDPLHVFLFNDGLLRIATEKYVPPGDSNLDHLFMHLTNYSINKRSENYKKDETGLSGSKRTLSFLREYIQNCGQCMQSWASLWQDITDIVVKTMIMAHPYIYHAYRMCRPGQSAGSDSVCFEVLGFDIILDKKLRPWLLEINRSPSFGTDESIDSQIKSAVLEDAFNLLNIRAKNKKKNLAEQKVLTQRRLLRASKKPSFDMSEEEKMRSQMIQKKKEELLNLLDRIKKEEDRDDYERRHCGRYQRVFPSDDRFMREKYAEMIKEAHKIYMSGQYSSMHQEIINFYCNNLKDYEIEELLTQCEADELHLENGGFDKPYKTSKPNRNSVFLKRSLPCSGMKSLDENSSIYTHRDSLCSSISTSNTSPSRNKAGQNTSRLLSPCNKINLALGEWDEEHTKLTLVALNNMKLKLPGKTSDETSVSLMTIEENWSYHKPFIAAYWTESLDSGKRNRLLDIVRANVASVLRRVWKRQDVVGLRLFRIFCRVFNRLLWNHGQGLINCLDFVNDSWQVIFNQRTDTISQSELDCCNRVVELSRNCLLIVYKYTSEVQGDILAPEKNKILDTRESSKSKLSLLSASLKLVTDDDNGKLVQSRRMARLYSGRLMTAPYAAQ